MLQANAETNGEKSTDASGALDTLRRARSFSETPATFERALQTYREAVAAAKFEPQIALEHARFLIKNSRGSSAEEILALSLAVDGSQIDALELYFELVRELNLPGTRNTWALRQMQRDIADAPESHRGALDYAIPHRLTNVLALIENGSDPVNRAIVRINALYETQTETPEALAAAAKTLSENDFLRAHITVVLGRGKRQTAIKLLASAPAAATPLNSLRRAIRRGRTAGRTKLVVDYITAYRRIKPDDVWAKKLDEEYAHNAVSNYQLGRTGFPFPKARNAPLYEPNRNRVFYLLHNSLPHNSAGYATRTHGLLSALNTIGWDVDGVTRLGYPYDMPGKAQLADVPMHDIVDNVDYRRLISGREIEKKNPLFFYTERYTKSLTELAKEHRPAVIHAASNHWNGLTAVKSARKLGIPSIYEVRGLWEVTRGSRNPEWAQSNMYKYMARMEADAAKGATRVFAITEALREEMVSRGVKQDKIEIIPNGVDTDRFRPLVRDEELAAALGVTGKTVIGYVGSVLDYEGIELLLESAHVLSSEREDFHVLIVGDGAELERFQDYVEEHELDRIVTFTGRVPHSEVERYYSVIDITPFPRLPLPVCEMVSPLKPFEAMAMGKAVIASDVAALKEIVTPGVNGFLHEKGNTESLTEELTKLLDHRETAKHIGLKAREWVVQERDWSKLATRISSAYAELTN